MKKYTVILHGGRGRYDPCPVSYMRAVVPNDEGDKIELYAEDPIPERLDPENTANFDAYCKKSYARLKAEILLLASEAHIDPACLTFWWD